MEAKKHKNGLSPLILVLHRPFERGKMHSRLRAASGPQIKKPIRGQTMKNFLSNHFTGSKSMNIAQGVNAIASQVNTIVQQAMSGGGDNAGGNKVCISTSGDRSPAIKSNGNVVVTYSEDGKSRTVVSQQIQGKGNICSGTGSVVINGVKMQGGESVTVIDGDVFISKKETKMEKNKERTGGKTIADEIKAEVLRLHGKAGQGFADALDALTKKPASRGRLEMVNEEFAALNLHESPVVMSLLSKLAYNVDSAKDQARNDVIRLRKETASVDRKIQAAHSALVDIIAAETEEECPVIELIERAKYAIKLLTGQD